MTATSTPTTSSFWSRAQQALLRLFVGRDSALRMIESTWTEASSEPRIVWCSGPSGIGKTALAQVAGARIRARGGRIVTVHESELLHARQRVAELGRDELPDVLVLDSESSLDGGLEEFLVTLLPQAGEHILVIVTARDAPPVRVATAFDGILRTVRLRPLSEEEAAEALARRGVAPAQREDIITLAGGVPRAIAELADRARADRPTPIGERSPHELAEIIALNVTRSAPSPDHRRALDALSVVPMLDAPLLQAMLPDAIAPLEALFTWLGEHAFVVREEQGLGLHPRVRDALHRDLCMRDPMQRKMLGDAAARLLLERMHASSTPSEAAKFYADAFFARREVRPPALSALLRHARKLAILASTELTSTARLKLNPQVSALLARATATLHLYGIGRTLDEVDLWVELETQDRAHFVATFHSPQLAAEPFGAAHLAGVIVALAYAQRHRAALLSLRLPAEFESELAPLGFAHFEESPNTSLFIADLAPSATQKVSSPPTDPTPASQEEAEGLDPKTLSLALRHAFAARFEPHALRRSSLLTLNAVQSLRAPHQAEEAALAALLDELCASLAASPAYASAARLLQVTYLDPSQPKQEAAAVDLGLPFGTYRYQLRRALDLAAQDVMRREEAARQRPSLRT